MQSCLTPSTAFPARPPTAEVSETRESASSKTSCLDSAKAWELNQRPRAPVAGDGVARSGLSTPDPAPPAVLHAPAPPLTNHASLGLWSPGPGVPTGPLVPLGTRSWHSPLLTLCTPELPLHPPAPVSSSFLTLPAEDTPSLGLLLPSSSQPPSLMNSHFCNDLTFSSHCLKEVFYTHTHTHPEPPNPRPMLSTPVRCA